MIPDISLMIGAYIVTRMITLPPQQANIVAKVLAVITVIVTIVCVGDLLSRGSTATPPALR